MLSRLLKPLLEWDISAAVVHAVGVWTKALVLLQHRLVVILGDVSVLEVCLIVVILLLWVLATVKGLVLDLQLDKWIVYFETFKTYVTLILIRSLSLLPQSKVFYVVLSAQCA